MKQLIGLSVCLFVLSGCATREYYNIHKKANNIESDKARCSYYAESRVPVYQPAVVVNINEKMTGKERRALEARQRQQNQQNEWKRDRKVREMRDHCLKAKGWRWRMV